MLMLLLQTAAVSPVLKHFRMSLHLCLHHHSYFVFWVSLKLLLTMLTSATVSDGKSNHNASICNQLSTLMGTSTESDSTFHCQHSKFCWFTSLEVWPKGLLCLYQDECLAAALKHFRGGMTAAIEKCDGSDHIRSTLEALTSKCLTHVSTDSVIFIALEIIYI